MESNSSNDKWWKAKGENIRKWIQICSSLKDNTGKKERKQTTGNEGDIKSTIILISYNSQNILNYISTEN